MARASLREVPSGGCGGGAICGAAPVRFSTTVVSTAICSFGSSVSSDGGGVSSSGLIRLISRVAALDFGGDRPIDQRGAIELLDHADRDVELDLRLLREALGQRAHLLGGGRIERRLARRELRRTAPPRRP